MFGKVIVFGLFEMIQKKGKKKKSEDSIPGSEFGLRVKSVRRCGPSQFHFY